MGPKQHNFYIKRFIAKSRSWLKKISPQTNQSSLLTEQEDGGGVCIGEAQALIMDWSDNGCSETAGLDWAEITDGSSTTITPWSELCDLGPATQIYYDGWGYWEIGQEFYDFYTSLGDGTNICDCVGLDNYSCGVIYGCMDPTAENYNSEATQSTQLEETEYNTQCIVDDENICICQYQPGCTNPDAENYDSDAIEDDGTCIILGCTDDIAENYNSEATEDDGTCEYIEGCTDDTMLNYNPSATFDDGSCIPIFEGCTDEEAFNFIEEANTDDGSCYYNPGCMDSDYLEYDPTSDFDNGTCSTPIIMGCMDEDYVEYDEDANLDDPEACINLIILGCTDENFVEYDEEANTDDDSCLTEIIYGCTDGSMFNYDPEATVDDDSCIEIVEGCTDPSYMEYVEEANTNDGSCESLIVEGCTDDTMFNYDPSANVDDGSCIEIVIGCTDPDAGNYEGANTDDGSCYYEPGCTNPDYLEYEDYYDFDDGSCQTLIIEGCTDPLYLEYDEEANVDNGSCQEIIVEGCTDDTALNYNNSANIDDGSCIEIVEGCMDETADNFDQFANVDDSNDCIYLGCTNSNAENYDSQANTDDGSCVIPGCTDPQYNEYNPEATEDDGSCETLGLTFLEGMYEYIPSQTSLDNTITSPDLNNYDTDLDGSISDDQSSTTELTLIEIELNNETSGIIKIHQIIDGPPLCSWNSPLTSQDYDFSLGDVQSPNEFNITINGGLYKLGVTSNGIELTPAEGQSPYNETGMFKGKYNSTSFMPPNTQCTGPDDQEDDSNYEGDGVYNTADFQYCAPWEEYFSQFVGGQWYSGTELGDWEDYDSDPSQVNYQKEKYCKLCSSIAQGVASSQTLSSAGFDSEYFSVDYCQCCDVGNSTQDAPKPINESLIKRLKKLAGINGRTIK